MASTRRPQYRGGTNGTGSGTGSGSGAGPASGGTGTDVISASKNSSDTGNGHARNSPGAAAAPADNVLSFPEPKGKRRKRILLSTIGIVAVLIAGIVAAAVYSPVLALRTVSVQGTKIVSPEKVQTALAPLMGKPLPQISEQEVRALLKPLVQVKDVTAKALPPSTLQVRITERIPVALVKQGNIFQLVDVDGVQLSTTKDASSVPLPVIDGGSGTLPKDLFQAITAVLGALPADVLSQLSNASAASADAVQLKLVDGQSIVWGNAGEKELKARVLAALLKVPADPKNPVQVYDVSVPRHPVTR
ncbi:cell division protein FtsQ/DivIB [Arthrobacter oryzae]|uniref:Cell division protein FtsQ n=1 Tax=Arthrobacter oryzae TaxID=409290 RepID=A0A495EDA8_9MICC|nr:FtsQ-type POTRA domain-containing protein [Arthrobacter oryzae]RKR13897.1 cell division protein FtsQ [Arthrobacter oryzae]